VTQPAVVSLKRAESLHLILFHHPISNEKLYQRILLMQSTKISFLEQSSRVEKG
jgi:hypothetical protein